MKDLRSSLNHSVPPMNPDLENEEAKHNARIKRKSGRRTKGSRCFGRLGHPSLQTQLLEESEAMARYALTSGLVVPADAVEKLEEIAAQMRGKGSDSDSFDSRTNGNMAGLDNFREDFLSVK